MKRIISTLMASFMVAATMTACGNPAKSKAEVTNEPTATEVPSGSVIKLLAPDKSLDATLMQALSERQSVRDFSDRMLSLEELSSLLWAANGVNREDGRRTAPSAVNAQDIDIYVCLASGAYLYDAKQSQLVRVSTDDLRPAVAGRQPMAAPVFLVMVGDIARYPQGLASQRALVESFAAMDAGYVSGNIGLYCAAAKLATVPRASMDKETLTKALGLKDTQILLLNNPVGYKK